MSRRIFITGIGIASALGLGVDSNLESLEKSRHGIQPPRFLTTRHNDFALGEVKYSNSALASMLKIERDFPVSRTFLLGCHAAREALTMAGLSPKIISEQLHMVNGTSVGGMDISEKGFALMLKGEPIDFAYWFSYHDCGKITDMIADYLGLQQLTTTISTACSSAANSIMQAGRNIRHGRYDMAIAGGSDALSLFTLNGFNSLKILDKNHCRPFDKNRAGLNLGEGAAYLVLESEKSLENTGSEPIAELVGYGNANDSYHQTASSPKGTGATLAMKKALQSAGVDAPEVDYINAHGTGTENNDQSESMAIKNIFGDKIPAFSSTKSYTGHTLAAAGGLEAVFSIQSLRNARLFPNLNLETPMDILPPPVSGIEKKKVNTVLSNSFGFGGNCTSLLFRKL